METIKAFFPKIRALFLIFKKRQGRTRLRSLALVTCLLIQTFYFIRCIMVSKIFFWKKNDQAKLKKNSRLDVCLYGIQFSNIFGKPSCNSNKKRSISSKNLETRSKNLVFNFQKFEVLGVSHIEFKVCTS